MIAGRSTFRNFLEKQPLYEAFTLGPDAESEHLVGGEAPVGVDRCSTRLRSSAPIISKRRSRAPGSAADCGPTIPCVASWVVVLGLCTSELANAWLTDMVRDFPF